MTRYDNSKGFTRLQQRLFDYLDEENWMDTQTIAGNVGGSYSAISGALSSMARDGLLLKRRKPGDARKNLYKKPKDNE